VNLYQIYNLTDKKAEPGAWRKPDAEVVKGKYEKSKPRCKFKLREWKSKND